MSLKPNEFNPSSQECRRFQAGLYEFLDGELNPVEVAKAGQHLGVCADCRREVEAARKCDAALATAPNLIASPGDLRPGFYLKLAETRRRKPIWQTWGVALPAALAAGLALFTMLHLPVKPQQGVARTTPLAISNFGASVQPKAPERELSPLEASDYSPETPIAIIDEVSGEGVSVDNAVAQGHAGLSGREKIRRTQVAKLDLKPISRQREDRIALAYNRPAPIVENSETNAPRDEFSADSDRVSSFSDSRSKLSLATFTPRAEVHISDEERDFMSASLQDTTPMPKNQGAVLGIDERDETGNTQPAELPALP